MSDQDTGDQQREGFRPFADILREIRNGALLGELSVKLNEGVSAVRSRGGSAELTIKIKVEASKGSVENLIVSDDVALKLPKVAGRTSFFFSTKGNNLTRKDPNQEEMKLSVVENKPLVVKDVDTGIEYDKKTGEVING